MGMDVGVFTTATPTGKRGRERKRRDWVRADVRCIACGRLLGRLLGAARQSEDGTRGAGQPVAYLGFRPVDPTDRIVPFTTTLRFRCRVCGGAGAVDDVEAFSTYDQDSDEGAEEPIDRGAPAHAS